ncbi:sugar phosphate isomerase/epimerase family protein [Mucisphaera sp.]|uniref:sugar phosphate isomerase/epimerase family protein n=1 Tax=Mucisphaera sp. TaxID=2913024 RepID=UPI003D0D7B5C
MWGVTDPVEDCFARFKAKGYDGVEFPSADKMTQDVTAETLRGALETHGLMSSLQTFTAGTTVAEHVRSFREELDLVLPFKPARLACHSGADWFSVKDAIGFYREIVKIEQDLGITVAHETHRGRVFYNPWTTRDVLQEVPEVKVLCDYSHWVCVCERIPDEPEIFELCADRCEHLHARIGYAEGPQVTDPDAPEFAEQRAAHEGWWRQIWDKQRERGDSVTTVTPEFGPPPYLHTLPFSEKPVADLEDLCDRQAGNLRALFKRTF